LKEEAISLVERLRREEMERMQKGPPPVPTHQQTIHYTELPEDTSASPIAGEWNLYRREVGRLLAEGHEGKWVLIKGERIVGMWATKEEAKRASDEWYPLQHVLIHQVQEREPVVFCTWMWRPRRVNRNVSDASQKRPDVVLGDRG